MMKNYNIVEVHWKARFSGGGGGENCLKSGGLDNLQIEEGEGLAKKGGFFEGVDTPMHTLWLRSHFSDRI